jgi:predicted lipoprotein with Yx(FWY)xxD motif
MRFASQLLATLLCAAGATAVLANPAAAPSSDPPIRKLDGHLVDLKGRGLYTWDGDMKGNTSQCNAQCRLLWPPLFADDNAVPKGPFTLVKRDDGRYQWALNGRPLYRWTSDKKWGDAGGDGVADMWRLVKVAPKKDAAK